VNWEAISAIGQIVGAIAVVISLIYLASEVRSNARATRPAAMRSMSNAFNRWIQQLVVHPNLSELYYRGIHDFESLKRADLVRFSALMSQAFRNSEELYYRQLEGHVDLRVWHGWQATIRDILEFRLGGVYARIASVRSLRSTLISYSRQRSLRGCIANQIQINDLTERCSQPLCISCTFTKYGPAKIDAALISSPMPFGRLCYSWPNAINNAFRIYRACRC
jgi:hypothetical protein